MDKREENDDERSASEELADATVSNEAPPTSPDQVDEDPGGTQSSHRLLAYSDALLSIIATVMILPVAHTKMEDDEGLDSNLQLLLATKMAVFFMTFLIVTMAWAAHVRLFQAIVRIDDTLALLNLACMMLITLLPYTFSLMATFPSHVLGILLFCGCVMVIGLIQSGMVLYAFGRPFLLEDGIREGGHCKTCKVDILKVLLRVPLTCLLAAICSFFCYQLSYVLLAAVVFLPHVSRGVLWCRDRLIGSAEDPEVAASGAFLLNQPLTKERVEAFSDGVYAIVATLLILDICEDDIPDPAWVERRFNGSLAAALRSHGPEYAAYLGSFATVGLLWFTHHSLFRHVRRVTRAASLLNALSLAFVGGLPLAFRLTHELPRAAPLDQRRAVRVACALVFGAGFFQLAVWATTPRPAGPERFLVPLKLALYPCVALVAFLLSCALSNFSVVIFHLMEMAAPLGFLLLSSTASVALSLLGRPTGVPHHPLVT
ncbi:endosomal/lysosomal proton channel TMEM175 [Stigmatopora argus]